MLYVCLKKLPYTLQSSDLNPIKNLWHAGLKETSATSLGQHITRNNSKLVASMLGRLQAVIDAHGMPNILVS